MTPPTQILPVQLDALRLAVVRLARELRRNAGAEVTPSQISALSVLHCTGSMRVSDLAKQEQISKPTATRLVGRLEEKGLVGRSPDDTDARSHTVSLTPAGLRLLESAAERSDDYLRLRAGELDGPELDRLLDAVDILQRLAAPRPEG